MKRLALILLLAGASLAPRAGGAAEAAAPYAGLEKRPIKALSADEIADLRAGRGMGLALAAELNGYPGPRHVLEHAGDLGLTSEQRRRTEALFAEMQEQAIVLGERLIAAEGALDRLFGEGRASKRAVRDVTLRVAQARGRLRAHHLRYHLTMRELLRPEQIARYHDLRGYANSGAAARLGDHHRGDHGLEHR